jgi:hypothetical protein
MKLDITELLGMLNEKPYVRPMALDSFTGLHIRYAADYRGFTLVLGMAAEGLGHSLKLLKERVREILSEEILARVKERAAQ